MYAIDLGTVNSLIACWKDILKKGVCFENDEGGYLTASAVCFHENGEVTVGNAARDYKMLEPDRVAMYFKRLMGESTVGITVDGKSYSPQQLSAWVLKKLKEDAKREGEIVENVVITVPAYFSNNSRQATYEAGSLAGLNVKAVLDEPSAAILNASTISDLDGKLVLIFDFGGGTLDCAIALVEKDKITILVICGNNNLGGINMNKLIIKKIKATQLKGMTLDASDEQELALKVEMAKCILSEKEKTSFTVGTTDDRVEIVLTREDIDECIQPIMEQVRSVLNETKEQAAGKSIFKVDKIVFAGGTTKMPQVKKVVQEVFPDVEIIAKDVERAVANGAALYAKALQDGNAKSLNNDVEVKSLKRATSRSYGVAAYCGDVLKICNMIYKNDTLPITIDSTFATRYDNQKVVGIDVYESTSLNSREELEKGQLVGTCTLQIAKELPKSTPFTVTFTLEEDGTLHVRGYEKQGNTEVKTTMKTSVLLTEEDFSIQKEQVEELLLLD